MDTVDLPSAGDQFAHVRSVIAVMLGLSIGRLLQGLVIQLAFFFTFCDTLA
jgi:hypothetical protein